MSNQRRKSHVLVIDRQIIFSQAFLDLSGSATKVLFFFLARRIMLKAGRKGKQRWTIENNGEIVFTYTEAFNKFGITKPRFRRALDDLIKYGFIDINHHGGGMNHDYSTYFISERWKDYGTEKFEEKFRPKDTRKLGFASGKWKAMKKDSKFKNR